MFTPSFKTLWISLFFVSQLIGGNATPIDARDEDTLVRTPGGLIPKSNIHHVPEGARIHHTPTQVQLIDADGTILHAAPLSKSDSSTQRTPFDPPPSNIVPRDLASGYVASAYWGNPISLPDISYFATSWTVPPAPAKFDQQLLYIFNGLVPNSFDAIIQPVLQYGVSPAWGGAYWAIGSWYVLNGFAYYTNLTEVSPGAKLEGFLQFTGEASSTYSWTSQFSLNGSLLASSLLKVTTTEVFTFAYEALEIYDATGSSDLPTGTTTMSGIKLSTLNASYPGSSISWTPASDTPDKISMSVISSSTTNGQVMITYP